MGSTVPMLTSIRKMIKSTNAPPAYTWYSLLVLILLVVILCFYCIINDSHMQPLECLPNEASRSRHENLAVSTVSGARGSRAKDSSLRLNGYPAASSATC